MKLKIKLLRQGAKLPKKAHLTDAAFDVYIPEDTFIKWDEKRIKIPLGFAMELPTGFCAIITHRSGFCLRGMESETQGGKKLFANADFQDGIIDADYRGEVCAILHNRESLNYVIKAGTRICQMLIHQVPDFEIEETSELSETDRADGGFTSTGTN